MVKLAIPSKGRIYQPTIDLLNKAGIKIKNGSERQLFAETSASGVEAIYARAADIPEYVQDGAADLGISSLDFVKETSANVELMVDLGFGEAELVLAVPEDSDIGSVESLPEKITVVTEFPGITKRFFQEINKEANVIEVSGATEMAPQVGIADAIIDLKSTGTTLRMNRLVPIKKILKTSAHLIGNKEFIKDRSEEAEKLKMAVKSVVRAEGKRYLVMNVKEEIIDEVIETAPGLSGPTVTRVESKEPMLSVQVVVDSEKVYKIVNKVKKIGAQDILIMPIERLIP